MHDACQYHNSAIQIQIHKTPQSTQTLARLFNDCATAVRLRLDDKVDQGARAARADMKTV